jgi:predicted transcriptional regulator
MIPVGPTESARMNRTNDELVSALSELAVALRTDRHYVATARMLDDLARQAAQAETSKAARRALSILACGELGHVVLHRDGGVSPEQSRLPKLVEDPAQAARNATVR